MSSCHVDMSRYRHNVIRHSVIRHDVHDVIRIDLRCDSISEDGNQLGILFQRLRAGRHDLARPE